MGHGIEINDSMFSARELPWHGLGVVVEETLHAAEALEVAGLDWEVELVPAFADTPKGMVDTNAYFPMQEAVPPVEKSAAPKQMSSST